ncbi:MAG: hypothetical protein ACOCV1_05700, partial [Bacillota bacterium]
YARWDWMITHSYLDKSAVLEGVKRVGKLGANKVLVGSSQQFYYSIGLRPFATSTLWKKRKKNYSY